MSYELDFLAIVSRPDFPSGTGPVGDYYNVRKLIATRSDWNAQVLELNRYDTEVEITDDEFLISQPGLPTFDVRKVALAMYLPICLEPEETLLSRLNPASRSQSFEQQQWRPITSYFESILDARPCLNRPAAMRLTNNKLIQSGILRQAEIGPKAVFPATVVQTTFPREGVLSGRPTLVKKNISEGGWISETEFSPARLVNSTDAPMGDRWPSLWQEPIQSNRELRCYVFDESVVTVELVREPECFDVRESNGGRPQARIAEISPDWNNALVLMTKALGLDYAVIDAIPVGDELHVLEVNANGVWWFLPADVQRQLESHFHRWLEARVDAARRNLA